MEVHKHMGRWGVFIENTQPDCLDSNPANPCYGSKIDALNALLQASAIIAAEMYSARGAYCNCVGGSTESRFPGPTFCP